MKIKHLLLLFYALYIFSIGYYTVYGVYKSYNEFFCKQQRPGPIDYREILTLDLMVTNTPLGGVNEAIIGYNEDILQVLPKVMFSGKIFKKDYKKEDSYFNLKCTAGEMYNRELHEYDVNETHINIYKPLSNVGYIDDDGFVSITELVGLKSIKHPVVKESYSTPEDYERHLETLRLQKLKCSLYKSTETCETLLKTSNNFYVTYLMLIVIACSLGVLSIFNINDYMLIRLSNKIMSYFSRVDLFASINFCNPIDGKPVYLEKNDKISILTNEETNLDNIEEINHFSDLEGDYYIHGNRVDCFLKTPKCLRSFVLELNRLNNLKKYFYMAAVNHKMCIVDESEEHYVKTLQVIKSLSEGKWVGIKNKDKSSRILKVNEFELEVLIKSFVNLKKVFAKKLLEHNWRFFSESYNIKALYKCLENKTWSTDRPSSVKNCQWKKYSSDVKHILDEQGLKSKCQIQTKPSAVLNDLQGINWQSFPVCEVEGKIIVKSKVKVSEDFNIKEDLNRIENERPKEKLITTNPGSRLKPDYRQALWSFKEGANKINQIEEKSLENAKDLKDVADKIKQSIFNFDRNLETIKPALLTKNVKIPEKIGNAANKLRRKYPNKNYADELISRNCVPVADHESLVQDVEQIIVNNTRCLNWALKIENYYGVLCEVDDLVDKHRGKVLEQEWEIDAKEYTKNVVLKEVKVNKRLRRKSGRVKQTKNNRLVKSGVKLLDKYISNDYNKCLEVIRTGNRIEGCRPRTIYCLSKGMVKSKKRLCDTYIKFDGAEQIGDIIIDIKMHTKDIGDRDWIEEYCPNLFALRRELQLIY